MYCIGLHLFIEINQLGCSLMYIAFCICRLLDLVVVFVFLDLVVVLVILEVICDTFILARKTDNLSYRLTVHSSSYNYEVILQCFFFQWKQMCASANMYSHGPLLGWATHMVSIQGYTHIDAYHIY